MKAPAHAPMRQHQTKISVVQWDLRLARCVYKPKKAKDSIDTKAFKLRASFFEFKLQNITQKTNGHIDIACEIFYANPCKFRYHKLIALCDGAQGVGVKGDIEARHHFVVA